MALLADSKIKEAISKGDIIITDFNEDQLGPNSYNLRLGNRLLVYKDRVLDMKKKNETEEIIIPEEGYILQPNTLYLGHTIEAVSTDKYVPIMHGRSSVGRLGIDPYVSAGFGDAGFSGVWTLELRVVQPVRVYAGVEICQLEFDTLEGEVMHKYRGKYQNSKSVVASRMQKDFEEGKGYY